MLKKNRKFVDIHYPVSSGVLHSDLIFAYVMKWSSGKSSNHVCPYNAITIWLTIFLILYITAPVAHLFYNWRFLPLNFLHWFTLLLWSAKSLQLYLPLWNSKDCSSPGSSVHEILKARILEWVAIPFSRDGTWISNVSCIGRWVLYH